MSTKTKNELLTRMRRELPLVEEISKYFNEDPEGAAVFLNTLVSEYSPSSSTEAPKRLKAPHKAPRKRDLPRKSRAEIRARREAQAEEEKSADVQHGPKLKKIERIFEVFKTDNRWRTLDEIASEAGSSKGLVRQVTNERHPDRFEKRMKPGAGNVTQRRLKTDDGKLFESEKA